MTKDIDALVAAADALEAKMAWISRRMPSGSAPVRLLEPDFITDAQVRELAHDIIGMSRAALTEYRAAREAVRKGTPPAYATSA